MQAGSADALEQRHVHGLISFTDLSGNRIELVERPQHSGRRYFPSRDAGITGFSHVGLCSTDAPRDEAFWCGVLGARVSDRIGDAALLRIDPVHHKVALFPTTRSGIQHVNHQVASIDDVMRAWYLLREKGVKIVFGPGRHPTSGAVFLYFEGPDGMVFEYSTGVRSIAPEQEASYRPRQFPAVPSSFCMWGSKPDIPEFRKEPMTRHRGVLPGKATAARQLLARQARRALPVHRRHQQPPAGQQHRRRRGRRDGHDAAGHPRADARGAGQHPRHPGRRRRRRWRTWSRSAASSST